MHLRFLLRGEIVDDVELLASIAVSQNKQQDVKPSRAVTHVGQLLLGITP